jgi:hypothetical protein
MDMKMLIDRFRRLTRLRSLGVLTLAAVLAGCGGGGSDGGTGSMVGDGATGGTTSGTGTVGVTLGDAPTDDYDRVMLTLSGIELIGGDAADGEPVVISEEVITVDLLALDAVTEFLADADDVPAGSYNQIRLQVDEITLETLDDAGNVATSDTAQIPGGGDLKLNPRGPFEVPEDGAVIVQIDLDANRSFQANATGNGMILFRPVVFVDVMDAGAEGDDARVSFLSGIVTRLAEPEGDTAFDLCEVQTLTGEGEGDRTLDECQRVDLGDSTVLFDTAAQPVDFAAVDDQAPAVVGGRFVESDDGLAFEALVVDLGPRDTFTRVSGSLGADAAEGSFALAVETDEGTREVAVSLADGALLFDREGALLDATALVAGAEVRAMGLAGPEDADPFTELAATAVSIRAPEEADDDEAEVEGTVTAFDGEQVEIMLADGATACALVDEETTVTLFSEDGEGSESAPGTVDDIQVDVEIDVSGETTDGDCVLARSVVVETGSDDAG